MSEQIVVKKTGVGHDIYAWSDVDLKIESATLMIYGSGGELLHAYSPGAWLEIVVRDQEASE